MENDSQKNYKGYHDKKINRGEILYKMIVKKNYATAEPETTIFLVQII